MKIYPSGIKRIQNVSLGEETDCSMNYSSERMKIHATWNRNKSLSLPLYTVTHNAIYEREREREAYHERRTMMRSFFQQELLNAKYPSVRTQRRKNFRKLVKVQWPGSTVSALPFIEIVFKNLKRKEKKKKGDYNNASRYFNKFIASFFLKSIPIHLQFP